VDVETIKRKILELASSDTGEGLRKILLVYNPRSSKAKLVKAQVFEPLRGIPGVMFGKFEVQPTDVDDNAAQLAKILADGDVVIAAGGDGTATIGLNGVMLSGKDVRFSALPFGNFNDMARTLKLASGREIYPLEAQIDGGHYRYAVCYFTIGMFAESTEVFDHAKTREKLKQGNKGIFFSIRTLAFWYFRNRHKRFIPEFIERSEMSDTRGGLNGEKARGVSDYLAINGVSVAKMMKGRSDVVEDPAKFLSATGKLNGFFGLMKFMTKSIFRGIPGRISEMDQLIFVTPACVEIQAEGEYKRLENVKKIVVKKAAKPVKIL
jgi:hypothetical protein